MWIRIYLSKVNEVPDLSNQNECGSGYMYQKSTWIWIWISPNKCGSGSSLPKWMRIRIYLIKKYVVSKYCTKKQLSMIFSEILEKMLQHFWSVFYFLFFILSKSIQNTPTDARVYSIVWWNLICSIHSPKRTPSPEMQSKNCFFKS
jgi:hypothetical protein